MTTDDKNELRRMMRERRTALPEPERRRFSHLITERLLHWPAFQTAQVVLLYAGVGSEVATDELTRRALAQGKKVLMPRCLPATRELLLVPITAWDELEPGFYGLLEPPLPTKPVPERPDLVVVPGVAFDPAGYRIGYGGGYYDRLLAHLGRVITVGLAFEVQVLPALPHASHDVPLAFIATEERLIPGRDWPARVEALG
ncbi:MAG TPA: 5-formyltetrahydrofolate cyclo-ligase [Firmicutes bacterium]|nr:5-formyltetrahydrofolate cyclo-ligase [Bacillota bacterium]